ncbi:MAG TPA: N-acetyltransferase [Candidatus Dormibacteraeota bacterium]|nr:N-acetyltransferase [Candidatus Dormibacteraeota bacterium]
MASSMIRLRPYQPADFKTLYRIDQQCFPRGIAYGRMEMAYYLRSEGVFCLLAEISENIPGEETIEKANEEKNDVAGFILTEQSASIAHIITLDVREHYRRRNLGSMLLQAAEREAAAQGALRIVLETATTNNPAIALWKKHGYRQSGTIANYYGRGLDALEMYKALGQPPEGT